MFAYALTGRVGDEGGTRKEWDRWHEELASPETGWLGDTFGITSESQLFAFVRYRSRDHAMRVRGLPAYRGWWRDFADHLDGASVDDCDRVDAFLNGSLDGASCIQLVSGRAAAVEELRSLNSLLDHELESHNGLLAHVVAWPENERFFELMYFTSENDAKEARDESSSQLRSFNRRWSTLVDDLHFFSILEPVHASAPPAMAAGPHDTSSLVGPIDDLLAATTSVLAVSVVTSAGLPIISALPRDVDETRMSAISASLLALGENATVEIGAGDLDRMILQGPDGLLVLVSAGHDAVLAVLAGHDAELSSLLDHLGNAATRLETALRS